MYLVVNLVITKSNEFASHFIQQQNTPLLWGMAHSLHAVCVLLSEVFFLPQLLGGMKTHEGLLKNVFNWQGKTNLVQNPLLG